jgi:hypothetical protein
MQIFETRMKTHGHAIVSPNSPSQPADGANKDPVWRPDLNTLHTITRSHPHRNFALLLQFPKVEDTEDKIAVFCITCASLALCC